MENAFLAKKVSFYFQFWEITKNIGVDYELLRELFIAGPRVNPSIHMYLKIIHTGIHIVTIKINGYCEKIRCVSNKICYKIQRNNEV